MLQLDNFRRLNAYGWPKFKPLKLWRQENGQKACAAAFVQARRAGGPAPIPLAEILEESQVTIEVAGEKDCSDSLLPGYDLKRMRMRNSGSSRQHH